MMIVSRFLPFSSTSFATVSSKKGQGRPEQGKEKKVRKAPMRALLLRMHDDNTNTRKESSQKA